MESLKITTGHWTDIFPFKKEKLLAICLMLMLAACGGSGSGSGSNEADANENCILDRSEIGECKL